MPKQQNNQRPQQPKQSKGGKPIGSRILYIVYGVILLLLVFNLFGNDGAAKQQITWERLEPILERHDYESITVINQETAEIKIKDEAIKNDPKRYRDLEQPSRFGQNRKPFQLIGKASVMVRSPAHHDRLLLAHERLCP